jgi:hypothetical protein
MNFSFWHMGIYKSLKRGIKNSWLQGDKRLRWKEMAGE